MSGWIKLEKDLESDPRTLRIVTALWPRNGGALPTPEVRNARVTQVVGALARLWMYADSHAREDDTLGMGAVELNEWLGIPKFCAVMPEDWMVIVDENTVELPDFHAKNGIEAKNRAVTAKRVERHRQKTKRNTVTPRNGHALPDQTRPDHKEEQPELLVEGNGKVGGGAARGTRLPEDFLLTPARSRIASDEGLDAARVFAKFRDYWVSVPGAKGVKLDWDATWRNWVRSEADRNPGKKPTGGASGLPTISFG